MTAHRINDEGIALLEEFEDFKRFPYPDPGSELFRNTSRERWGDVPAIQILDRLDSYQENLSGEPWTQGFGFTKGITPHSPEMTIEQARARLLEEVAEFTQGVIRLLTRPANENQLAAMVVLAFNIGLAGFARSSVLRLHNAGDFEGAARAFALWNKAGGRVMRGLVRRRAAEAALYLKPVRVQIPVARIERGRIEVPELRPDPEDMMPQRIEPERPLMQSRIVQASGVSGGVAGLTLAAEGARAVADIRFSLGDWLPYIALAVVLVAAGWAIYERFKQRREGRA